MVAFTVDAFPGRECPWSFCFETHTARVEEVVKGRSRDDSGSWIPALLVLKRRARNGFVAPVPMMDEVRRARKTMTRRR
jgi:hypothetical protein